MHDFEAWRTSSKTIDKSKRYYSHLDCKTDITKCWDYISDPVNISRHSFYPFIHYIKETSKFSKDGGTKVKKRDICYAAHIDRCIYQLYNYMLNNLYNKKCIDLAISAVAVAYRTNLCGQSNIHFAKRALDFVRKNDGCYIMIGDFTKFFDNLNHEYLKKMWCALLNVPRLPADHFSVFKNITRFSRIELTDLLKLHGLNDSSTGRKELNLKTRVLSPIQLREKAVPISEIATIGIPQGSPMSGVLANIYMLEADKELHDFISSLGGLYMRYSDDFVVVLPRLGEKEAIEKLKYICNIFNNAKYPNLTLESSKTQYYHFSNKKITNCGMNVSDEADCSNLHLNFLGFKFDGEKISLRDKTASKYYQRMRRKAKTISVRGGFTKKGNRISMKNLYMKYSERGAYSKTGNFLSYANRADEQFGADELINLVNQRNMYKREGVYGSV